jgi:hypothetical protein
MHQNDAAGSVTAGAASEGVRKAYVWVLLLVLLQWASNNLWPMNPNASQAAQSGRMAIMLILETGAAHLPNVADLPDVVDAQHLALRVLQGHGQRQQRLQQRSCA